jgi:spore maturation protein CgeB
MSAKPLNIVILGLSVTSSWGNGHATTYRALVRELCRRGHQLIFLERDVPWYRNHRDISHDIQQVTQFYEDLSDLDRRFRHHISKADLVIVGSYVPEGVLLGEWVIENANGISAFYDIDTPVTLAKLDRGDHEYLSPDLIPEYQLYLSFTGGPTLKRLEQEYGSPMTRPFYCSVDPIIYRPRNSLKKWDLGYLGTYSPDRQSSLTSYLLEVAENCKSFQFVVAGPQYPNTISWPKNVQRIEHLPPSEHCVFYNQQKFTLNITRADMLKAGYSPSVRLFEAAACGIPIISDFWEGLDSFFKVGEEILVTQSAEDVVCLLSQTSSLDLREIGQAARRRILREHTATHRAIELENYVMNLLNKKHDFTSYQQFNLSENLRMSF